MPRTLYQNNDVAPTIHRMRAFGGPIFNVIGLLLSLTIFQIAFGHPIAREWMGWSAVGHGYILVMSLLPLPIVDEGTILKWTLVARGKTEVEADDFVRRVDWVLGIILVTTGIGLLLMRMWIIGLILLVGSGIIFGITAGKIR